MRSPRPQTPGGAPGTAVRPLAVANALGGFDRFLMPPLLLVAAADLGATLVEVSLVATIYYVVYGAAQPMWGLLSGRIGRARTIRLGLAVGGVAVLAAAAAPGLGVFLVARAASALCFAAIVPTSLIFLGETVPAARRQGAVADLLSGAAIGMTVAAVVGGVAADAGVWRLMLVALGIASLVQAVRFPPSGPRTPRLEEPGALGRTAARWGAVVLALGGLNASLALGTLSFVPVAAEHNGEPARLAGLAVAWYGLSYWAGNRMVKRVSGPGNVVLLLAGGAATLAAGLAVAAAARGWVGFSVATAIIGSGFAFTNSSLQLWATEVAPQARALAVSLFTTAGWVGGGIATAAAAPLAQDGRFTAVFAGGAAGALALALAGPLARASWQAGAPGRALPEDVPSLP